MNKKTAVIFDCQSMPKDLKAKYLKLPHSMGVGNDVFLEWYWTYNTYYEKMNPADMDWLDRDSWDIQKWMISEGLTEDEINHSTILVKHWW